MGSGVIGLSSSDLRVEARADEVAEFFVDAAQIQGQGDQA